MPLTDKGRKIKANMVKRYGQKKGESIFYAMENSGKLTKVVKAKGGMDASKTDFKVSTPSPGDTGGAGGFGNSTNQFGQTGSSPTSTGGPNQVVARKGPFQVPQIGPLSVGINLVSKYLYNKKNLKEARETDILGGEMLTTGQKKTPQATVPTVPMGGDRPQLCPDGSYPPCKQPQTQSYFGGGEIVISSNVDKDLL